ncbi:septum formation family protein [Nocardiopsis kunsanensis]|uniref:Septum formation-related domain-containing protein n=1 Tax=Nocardiopsis kunsanensis TaxID=141693 RepID=A0A918XAU2_9ACTN|nr:septum formation family protein [Nocardiopsis kunsanensis]GHD21227.1 hypothetical protein GCM10007147_14400 [Nocardiopsis kunsanensis]
MPSVLNAPRIASSVVALGAAAVLTGCGVLTSALGGGELGGNVLSVGVGDCFVVSEMDQSLLEGEVSDVPLVDCSEPHDGEFFHVEVLPDGDFPGDRSVGERATEACEGQAFTDFVGTDYASSEIWAYHLVPTRQSWEQADDREILCYLETTGMVNGSQQGAGI